MKKTAISVMLFISIIALQAQNGLVNFNSLNKESHNFRSLGSNSLTSSLQTKNKPYKMSIGGVVSAIGIGPSYKAFLGDFLAFQTDLLWKTLFTFDNDLLSGANLFSSVELYLNVMCQNRLKETKKAELFWFMGGGISLGYETSGNGKFGVNALMGLEYVFVNTPFSFQMDIRPGYGMLFNSGKELKGAHLYPSKNPWSFFDWMIGFGFRYAFK